MTPANNVNKPEMTKKEAKKMQKMIKALQKEMADSVLEVMRNAKEPMDIEEIIAAYPNNERRKSCKDDKELKLYISMGLGKLIEDKKVRELPKTDDGRFLLEVV